jgi:hypothetical protein
MRKPVWLLDIDGVINAVVRRGGPVPRHMWADQWVDAKAEASLGETFRIVAATPVLDFIREVHEKDLAEIRWHTTWQHSAANVAELLDLPEFPVHEAPEFAAEMWFAGNPELGKWWKLPGAFRVVGVEQRPLVWTDDDVIQYTTKPQRAALRALQPSLLIDPWTSEGLAQVHLDKIRKFLEEQNR